MRRGGAATVGRNGHAGAAASPAPVPTLRAAVYCRKSVEERVATDFGSIDAQRESGEAYVRAREEIGWTLLPGRYEDEGYTGANVERPALQRLLQDIEAKRVDVVVVYKVDRLSRSLLDFARLMEAFGRHGVEIVSVTQAIDTTTSTGRLMLNVLFSFAQFEREMISERTKDKMRAARRKGKFTGGALLLGFDLLPEGRRLVANEAEAERVRALFDLFLERKSLVAVVAEANERGWATKSWTTRKDRLVPGRRLTTTYLRNLFTNAAYIGKVRIDGETYAAECPGIVDPDLFDRAQALLAANGTTGAKEARNRNGALLKGLLRCTPCDAPMVATHTTKDGRQYRYYLCRKAQDEGWDTCPTKSVRADEMERLVVEQIRVIGADAGLQAATLDAARAQAAGREIDADDLRRVLALWDDVWAALVPKEQARVLTLLIERVGYDGAAGKVALRFRPMGIRALSAEVAP